MTNDYVFLHGSPGSSLSWDPLLTAAPATARCHAWNLLDHGGGPDAARATVDDIVEDVVVRCRALQGPIVLVGHSFGTWVAGRAIAQLQALVTRFVGIGGLAALPADIAARSVGFADALESGQLSLAVAAGMACDIWLPNEGRRPEHVRWVHTEIEGDTVTRLCRVLRRHPALADPARRVPPSTVRATLLHATGDRGSPIALGRDLAGCFAGSTFIERPGDSHFLHWTETADVARIVFGDGG